MDNKSYTISGVWEYTSKKGEQYLSSKPVEFPQPFSVEVSVYDKETNRRSNEVKSFEKGAYILQLFPLDHRPSEKSPTFNLVIRKHVPRNHG